MRKIMRLFDEFLHRFSIYRLDTICSMLSDIANDYRCDDAINDHVTTNYVKTYSTLLSVLYNADVFSENDRLEYFYNCVEFYQEQIAELKDV